jgi:hypothetical protein
VKALPAIVHDPKGPIGWRFAPYAVAAALAVAAGAAGVVSWLPALVMFTLSASTVAMAPLFPGRVRPRRGTVTVGPGSVHIRSGIASQTLRVGDVTGASTARLEGDRVVLSIARSYRSGVPIALELESERDAAEVLGALGVGRSGFGAVAWPLEPRAEDSLRTYAWLAAAGALAILGLVAWKWVAGFGDDDLSVLVVVLVGLGLGVLPVISVIDRMLGQVRGQSQLALRGDGLHVATRQGARCIPFRDVHSVAEVEDRMVITEASGWVTALPFPSTKLPRGLSREDRAVVMAQIRSAAARARGLGELPADTTALEPLAHRPGEPASDWLARVEQAANVFRSGYRGATFGPEDLWRVADDPDAAPDLRAAAARVLVRVDAGARPRVAALTEAVRDPRARALVRAGWDDEAGVTAEAEAALEEIAARQQRS